MKIVGIFPVCALTAFAAEAKTAFDEITVSATKIATPLLEVPATVVRNNVTRFGLSCIVREAGVNEYRRIQNFDFGPARAYLARTKDYWAAVRAEWKRMLAGKQPVDVAGGAAVAEALNRVYELANETTLEPARILEAQELIRAAVRTPPVAMARR